jgi:hypothetical protein
VASDAISVLPARAQFERSIATGARICALLDAAREPAGPYRAREAGLECQSLFAGELGDMLNDVAPHIIAFPPRSPFRQWWFGQWGDSIGVLLEAPAGLAELRRHFRGLTVVRDERRKRYFFRFYDPRVLRVFLPACTPDELRQFFGPITNFYCESEDGQELLVFSVGRDGLTLKRSPLHQPPPHEADS